MIIVVSGTRTRKIAAAHDSDEHRPSVDAACGERRKPGGHHRRGDEEEERREPQITKPDRGKDPGSNKLPQCQTPRKGQQQHDSDCGVGEEGAVHGQVRRLELGDAQELRHRRILVEIEEQSPAIRVDEERSDTGHGDARRRHCLPPIERRRSKELTAGEDRDERHAEHDLAVQVAPQRDDWHAPPQRFCRSRGDSALDNPAHRREPQEGREVRPRNGARFDHQKAKNQQRQRWKDTRPQSARKVDERQRAGDGCCLQGLDPDVPADSPCGVRGGFRQPRSVALAILRVRAAKDIGAHEPARHVLAAVCEVPSQIGLVDGAKADDHRQRHHDYRDHCPEPWCCHEDNINLLRGDFSVGAL